MTCEFAGYLGLSVLKLYFENNGDLSFVYCGLNLSKSWYHRPLTSGMGSPRQPFEVTIRNNTHDQCHMNLFWAVIACFRLFQACFRLFQACFSRYLVGRAGFSWFWVVSGGFGWFCVIPFFSNKPKQTFPGYQLKKH